MSKVYNGKFIETKYGFVRIDEISALEKHGNGIFLILKNGKSIDYGYFGNTNKANEEIHDLMDIISSYENENLN